MLPLSRVPLSPRLSTRPVLVQEMVKGRWRRLPADLEPVAPPWSRPDGQRRFIRLSGGQAAAPEVRTELPPEVLPARHGDPRVVIDDDDDWLRHVLPLCLAHARRPEEGPLPALPRVPPAATRRR